MPKAKAPTMPKQPATPAALPAGWRWVRFGEVVRDVNQACRDPQAEGLERFIGLDHLDPENLHIRRWGLLADSGITFIKRFHNGQVLFGKRRAYQRKVAVAEFDGICSGDILTFQPKADDLIPELLPFILQSDGFFDHALGTSAGSLSPRTRWSQLQDYTFPLPPKDEQRRIAEILWAADEVGEAYSSIPHQLDGIIASIRECEFVARTDTAVQLRDLCGDHGIQIGPFGSQLHVSDYVPTGIPVVMPVHLSDDRIAPTGINRVSEQTAQRLRQHRLQAGDILLARRGDLSKRAFVRDSEAGWLCGTGCIRVRTIDPSAAQAVFHALAAPSTVAWINQHAVGTTMPNTNGEIVSRIPIRLPGSDRLEQVLASLDALETTRPSALAHVAKVREVKNAVLTHLISGSYRHV